MNAYLQENRVTLLVFLPVFLLSRIWVFQLGVEPNYLVVLEHWQHADLKLLDESYWQTLWYQHSQPPLWNGLIGVIVNLFGNDAGRVTGVMHVLFIGMSFTGWLMLLEIFKEAGLRPFARAVLASVVILSPSVIFYENYIFYPHFTWFLVTLFLFAAVKRSKPQGRWPVLLAVVTLGALSWTWAIFHPLFILVLGLGVLWGADRIRSGKMLILLGSVILLSCIPIAKNILVASVPSASSWVGMNITQTAVEFGSEKSIYCDFYLVHQEIWKEGRSLDEAMFPSLRDTLKSSGHSNMNHIAMAKRSQECAQIAASAIASNPIGWTKARFAQVVTSHKMPSFEYFHVPTGWAELGIPRIVAERITPIVRNLLASHFLALVLWAAWKTLTGDQKRLYLLLLVFVLGFTIASHFANGEEQQRMRYTISPIYWFLTASMLHSLSLVFIGRRTGSGIRG